MRQSHARRIESGRPPARSPARGNPEPLWWLLLWVLVGAALAWVGFLELIALTTTRVP